MGKCSYVVGSSRIESSAKNGSGLTFADDKEPGLSPTAPTWARLRSAELARRRSLEFMYITLGWLRLVFRPQLSCDGRLCSSGVCPRSTDRFPILRVSSCSDTSDPQDDGRDDRKSDRKPPDTSRLGDRGDLGAVNAERPEGGFEVRMMGGAAASSSRRIPSCTLPKGGE